MLNKFLSILLFSLLVIFGVGFIGASIYSFHKSIQSEKWIPTEATIKSLELKLTRTKKGNGYNKEVLVTYTYRINGIPKEGNRISFGFLTIPNEDAQLIYDKLQGAEKFSVFVNPKNDTESVIIPGIQKMTILTCPLSIILWAMIAIFLSALVEKDKNFMKNLRFISLIAIIISIISIFYIHIKAENMGERIIILATKTNTNE